MLVSILLVTAFASCEPTEEPIVEPLKPTIEVSSSQTEISYGDSCILTITVTNTITVSSELDTLNVVTNKFQITTPKLTQTTTYHFIAHGEKGLVVGSSITIKVKPLPVAPTVKVTAVPDTILRGNSSSIRLSKGGDVTKTLVNGVIFEGNSFPTGPLYLDTKFVVEVFGVNQEYAKDSVIVHVDLPLSYLTQNHFYVILKEIKDLDGTWIEIYGKCTYTDTLYFKTDYSLEVFRVCDAVKGYHSVGGGPWVFNDDQTKIYLGSWNDILELTDKTFKVISESGNIRITYLMKKNQ